MNEYLGRGVWGGLRMKGKEGGDWKEREESGRREGGRKWKRKHQHTHNWNQWIRKLEQCNRMNSSRYNSRKLSWNKKINLHTERAYHMPEKNSLEWLYGDSMLWSYWSPKIKKQPGKAISQFWKGKNIWLASYFSTVELNARR